MLGVFGEIFYWVFNMSIAASIAGLVVLLIGRIRRLPRRIAGRSGLFPSCGCGCRWGWGAGTA